MFLRYIENLESELSRGNALLGINGVHGPHSKNIKQLKSELVSSLDLNESLERYLKALLNVTGPCSFAHFLRNQCGDLELGAWVNHFRASDVGSVFFDSLADKVSSILVNASAKRADRLSIPGDVSPEDLFGIWFDYETIAGMLFATRSDDGIVSATLAFRQKQLPLTEGQCDFIFIAQHLFAGQLERLRAVYSRSGVETQWPPDWSSGEENA